MGWGSMSWAEGRAARERRVVAITTSIVRGIAAIGVLLVAWFFGFMGYAFDDYWPALSLPALLAVGAGLLLWRKRWEGVAVGAGCWLLVCLGLWTSYHSDIPAFLLIDHALPGLFLAIFSITLTANAWAQVKWLWSLPMRRLQVIGILCSLSLGAVLTARPYWVAKFSGRQATLRHAVLFMAYLDSADLRGADLSGANLIGAQLEGANLRGADLRGVKLTGAVYDCRTKWPGGFDPKSHGARTDPWVDCCEGE